MLGAQAQGLEKYIVTYDDEGAVDEDGDGVADEIEEVRSVLWENHHLLYMIFDYYASIGASSDIFHIDLNAYHLFLEQCRLVVEGDPSKSPAI